MKYIIYSIFLITAIVIVVIRYYKTNRQLHKTQEIPDGNCTFKESASDYMIQILKDLGCQPEVNSENTIIVEYQGEKFLIEYQGYIFRIWDPWWNCIDVNSPDLRNLMEAVNAANHSVGPTIVYSNPDEEGSIHIHTRMDISFYPSTPEPKLYMRSVLNSFFSIKQTFYKEFNTIEEKEKQLLKNGRPIGFKS